MQNGLVNGNNEYRLFEAELLPSWNWFRWISCSTHAKQACLYVAVVYGLVGCSHREEERRSFRCIVTPTQVVFQQMLYACGCCQRTENSVAIPVADIIDAELIPECCCDPCYAQDARTPVHFRISFHGDHATTVATPECDCCTAKVGKLDIWCAKDGLLFQAAVRKAVADYRAARATPAGGYLVAGPYGAYGVAGAGGQGGYGVPTAYAVGAPKWQG